MGARWATAAVCLYAVIGLFFVPSFGGSSALTPVAWALTAVAVRRDRRTKRRDAAIAVTVITVAICVLSSVWHVVTP